MGCRPAGRTAWSWSSRLGGRIRLAALGRMAESVDHELRARNLRESSAGQGLALTQASASVTFVRETLTAEQQQPRGRLKVDAIRALARQSGARNDTEIARLIGISPASLSKLLRGLQEPGHRTIRMLAACWPKVPIEDLVDFGDGAA